MKYEEKTISTKEIYHGKLLDLRVEKVLLHNGNMSDREIIKHSGACAVVAVNEGKLLFVKQFRKPIEMELLELPAGKLDPGEDPEHCAARELQEETGFIANNLIKLGHIYTTPGFSNEVIHIYFTDRLTPGKLNRDEDEFMDISEIIINDVYDMIDKGEIQDAKTISALMMAYRYLRS